MRFFRWKRCIALTVDSLALGTYCGGPDGYVAALGKVAVAGLPRGEYIASPRSWSGVVSQKRLVSVDNSREAPLVSRVEGFRVELSEVVRSQGFVDTGIGYHAGG